MWAVSVLIGSCKDLVEQNYSINNVDTQVGSGTQWVKAYVEIKIEGPASLIFLTHNDDIDMLACLFFLLTFIILHDFAKTTKHPTPNIPICIF